MKRHRGKGGRFRKCVDGCNSSGLWQIMVLDLPYGYPKVQPADNHYCDKCKRKVVSMWDGALEREEVLAA